MSWKTSRVGDSPIKNERRVGYSRAQGVAVVKFTVYTWYSKQAIRDAITQYAIEVYGGVVLDLWQRAEDEVMVTGGTAIVEATIRFHA